MIIYCVGMCCCPCLCVLHISGPLSAAGFLIARPASYFPRASRTVTLSEIGHFGRLLWEALNRITAQFFQVTGNQSGTSVNASAMVEQSRGTQMAKRR